MTGTAAATTATLANTLKWAAWVAFTYAAVVIVNTTVLQALNYWVQGLTRAAAFVAIGVGLLRRARWAWLLGLALSSFHLGAGGIDFTLWLAFRTPCPPRHMCAYWSDSMLPPMVAPVAAVAASLLAAFVVLLVHPRTRAATRRAAV